MIILSECVLRVLETGESFSADALNSAMDMCVNRKHVSFALDHMEKIGLVKCLKYPEGDFYQITDDGLEALMSIQSARADGSKPKQSGAQDDDPSQPTASVEPADEQYRPNAGPDSDEVADSLMRASWEVHGALVRYAETLVDLTLTGLIYMDRELRELASQVAAQKVSA